MSDLPEWLRQNLQNEEMLRFNNDRSNRRTVAVLDEVTGELVAVTDPQAQEQR